MREDRLVQMESYIREHKSVSLDKLCEVFDVSKNTVRRDVSEIVSRTDIQKVYGGVSVQYNKVPPPFAERSAVNQDIKDELGRLAAALVDDDDVIFIDSGTTTCRMVDHLVGKRNVTILTHSLDVMNRAVSNPELRLISLSGTFNRKTFSFTSENAVDTLRACNIRKAFMASTGITAENGATQSLSIEFSIKKTAVEHSEQIILMVENRKFGVVSLLTYCPASDIDTIVTDVQPPQDFCRAYSGRIITP